MFKKNSLVKYLLYAIGEIFLVVIGILLALQINNWNEKRKSDQELNSILKIISYDLATDTIIANQIITYYEQHQKDSKRIVDRELNKDNFQECPTCMALATQYQPFTIQKKGVKLLDNFSNQHINQRDSLVTNISQFYTIFDKAIENNNKLLDNDAINNLNDLKQYPWFVDLIQGKIKPEMISYFTDSNDYRTKVAAHAILAHNNHLPFVKAYKRSAKEILRLIEERFKNNP
ncbi:hypothetical protein GTQ40_16840 [Flavobacteriaceae bacterium R38]|nr:hypothetical protein [Flavobacteriaceae bacterium R38]